MIRQVFGVFLNGCWTIWTGQIQLVCYFEIVLFILIQFLLAYCAEVSDRVLTRICLYWLPRYLLHLRVNQKMPDKVDHAKRYLEELIDEGTKVDNANKHKSFGNVELSTHTPPETSSNTPSTPVLRPIRILRKRPHTTPSSDQTDVVHTTSRMPRTPESIPDDDSGFEEGESSPIYTVYEDQQYRHKMRHLVAALRSDDFAAGPFQQYLEKDQDPSGIFALVFWQEVERFREDYAAMEQSHLLETIDQIATKYVLTDHGFELIPSMSEFGEYILDIDILECFSFPWSLRVVQRRCMEYLTTSWHNYLLDDTTKFQTKVNISIDQLEKRVRSPIYDEMPPLPQSPMKWPPYSCSSSQSKDRPGKLIPIIDQSVKRPSTTLSLQSKVSQKDQTATTSMAKRSKRSYRLIEQTCRLTTKILQQESFLSDESDDDGIVGKSNPVFLRKPKMDMKTLAMHSAKEYPSSGAIIQKAYKIQSSKTSDVPAYLKSPIRKNGVIYKRPTIRPKHLVDCLRDPVHFEFFRRFAKAFNFERAVRFWKAVEEMKRVNDPKLRQTKIRQIVTTFFSKEGGIGINGQIITEIMETPPDKVNGPMLISAQACVMKALEEMWGERYLATFAGIVFNIIISLLG